MSVGLILLAAGGSRRLGTSKQLLRDEAGRSLIRRSAHTALASVCRPIVAVLGAESEQIGRELEGLMLEVAVNRDWQTGLASSLRVGLQTLTSDAALDAIVVMLCDQPRVTSELLDSLVAAHQSTGQALVACEYDGLLGVPALFGRSLFDSLAALREDEGARHVIRSFSGPVTRVPFPEGRFDVDTSEDARAFGLGL